MSDTTSDTKQLTTELGTPYTVTQSNQHNVVRVTVGDHKASKLVKRDGAPRTPGTAFRYRSLADETFDTLDAVADSMRWAL